MRWNAGDWRWRPRFTAGLVMWHWQLRRFARACVCKAAEHAPREIVVRASCLMAVQLRALGQVRPPLGRAGRPRTRQCIDAALVLRWRVRLCRQAALTAAVAQKAGRQSGA